LISVKSVKIKIMLAYGKMPQLSQKTQ